MLKIAAHIAATLVVTTVLVTSVLALSSQFQLSLPNLTALAASKPAPAIVPASALNDDQTCQKAKAQTHYLNTGTNPIWYAREAHPVYQELLRNTERHYGEILWFGGSVQQVIEAESGVGLLVEIFSGDDLMLVTVDTTYRFLEGDPIVVLGTIIDRFSYETVLGVERTVPMLHAMCITYPTSS